MEWITVRYQWVNSKIFGFFYLSGKITPNNGVLSLQKTTQFYFFAESMAKASCFNKNKIYRL